MRRAYLCAYNVAQCSAWTAALVLSALALSRGDSLFAAAGSVVSVAQAATALETLHAALGVVRSDVATNLVQFAGRGHTWLRACL
jgi:hypothetical protein